MEKTKEELHKIIVEELKDGSKFEHVIIDRGNGEFTSMLKSTYDATQSATGSATTPTETQGVQSTQGA